LNAENGSLYPIWPTRLRAPFLIIIVSLVMALISIIFSTYSYLIQYISELPEPSFDIYRWFATSSMLIIPLFLLGISLLLLLHMQTKGTIAQTSKLIFICGTIYYFVGVLINIIIFHILFRSDGLIDNFDLINRLSYCGEFMSELGIIFCIIATIFLVRSYLKGEIFGFFSS